MEIWKGGGYDVKVNSDTTRLVHVYTFSGLFFGIRELEGGFLGDILMATLAKCLMVKRKAYVFLR